MMRNAPSAVTSLFVLLLGAGAWAASFTPGDIVVYRIGDGTTMLSGGVGYPVFLDEYTPDGALVQSVSLPITTAGSNHALIASGTAGTEGQLTRSVNSQYLLLTGYDAAVGTDSLIRSLSTTVARTVGRVDYNGAIDTSTALRDFSNGDKPRSAASTDGTNIWLSCGGKPNDGTDGVHYTTLGSTTSTKLSTTFGDSRQVNVFGGQLYVSSQNTSVILIGTLGTGTPTTSGQTITALPGVVETVGKPEGFFFADLDTSPGLDTLYVADENAGIQKWSLVSGTWLLNNALAPASDTLYGITGSVDGPSVKLYATGSTAANNAGTLYAFIDRSGYNGSMSGTLNTLATAATNETFRGVALAPAATATPSIGDCDGSGDVTVDELIAMVNIALGNAPLSSCTAGDADVSGEITIDEILAAVNNTLNGYPMS